MLRTALLRRLRRWLFSQAVQNRPWQRRPGFRPLLECLEERTVPANLLVTSAADPAFIVAGTLRFAVLVANQDAIAGQSDTITFDTAAMGTSTVTLTRGALVLDVSGAAVPVGTETIDGGGAVSVSGNHLSGVLAVDAGVQAVLTGLTIQDGNAASGGGIYNDGTLTVSNATLSGNSATGFGGGIWSSGTLTVSNATLSGNSATAFGGGIFNDGTLTVDNTSLSGNSAINGGGITNHIGTVTVSNATFTGNSATAFGGGIENYGTLTVTNSTLSGNSAAGFDAGGGGIINVGTLTVSNSTLSGNFATIGDGGGITNIGTVLTVTNATFSGNSAGTDGGGIANRGGSILTVNNATLSANSAASTGGGIFNYGLMTLQSTIVAGNTAPADPDINEANSDGGSAYDLIGDGSGSGLSDGVNGNQVGSTASPLNPLLGPLGNYGGPTQTMALLPGSPAIGQGEPAGPGVPTTDQRGFPRPNSGPVDVGAFQVSPLVVTTAADPGGIAGKLSLREAVSLANQDALFGQSDTITFDTAQMGTPMVTLTHGRLTLDVSGAAVPVGTETIDGGGAVSVSGNHASGVFAVDISVQAVLTGLTIQDGFISGGIENDGTLTVTNSTLSGNSAPLAGGGGINNYRLGTLTVSNATFSSNSATFSNGGGIDNLGTATVSNATFSGNSATFGDGGGIDNPGTLMVSNATFSGNSAIGGGGIDNLGTATVRNSTLDNNSATGFGGGISNASTLTVSNATLSANSAADGGGIFNTSTLTVDNTTLSGNSATFDGGGIWSSGTLTVDNTTLSGNSATGFGGGIHTGGTAGTLAVSNSNLGGNSATNGGGISNDNGGTVTVSDSTLSGNSASGGGGISNDSGGTVTVSNSTLSNNAVTAFGGGISNDNGGTMTVSNSTLSGNSAADGGGIINLATGTLTVNNSTFSGNSAAFDGGGIWSAGTLTVNNATLSGNSATGFGGGIFTGGSLTLRSSIVAANTAFDGPDVYEDGLDLGSAYNLIGDGSASGFSDGVNSNQVGSTAFPLDPLLASLGDAGGPTQTLALLPGSPAIGHGEPAGFGVPNTDQRGFPRPAFGPVDVGAFQMQNTAVAVSPAAALFDPASQMITLTATVTDNGLPLPVARGAVAFTVIIPGGTNLTASAAIDASDVASALLTLPPGLAAGSYTIDASYSDNTAAFGPSSGSSTLTVLAVTPQVAVSNVTLTFSPKTAQTATLTATITNAGQAVGEGSVSFVVSAPSATAGAPPIVLGTTAAVAVNGSGVASTSLPVPAGSLGGVYTIQASFTDSPGSGTYTSASGTGTLTINPAATTITLKAVPALTYSNGSAQKVSLVAYVTSSAGSVATGSVTFIIAGQPPVTVAVNSSAEGSAMVTIPAGTAAGSYAITATYADQSNAVGGSNFAGSSVGGTLTIKQAATKVTASGSATYRAGANQQVTLTAKVTSSGSTVNGGSVTFTYAGQTVTGQVNTKGVATATVTVKAGTPAGAYSFTVAYGGAANFLASTGTGTLTVKADSTHLSLTGVSVPYNATIDQQVTVTATVTAGLGGRVTEGSVTFTYGTQTVTVTVNSQGVATATLTVAAGTAPGKYKFTVSYADALNVNNKFDYNTSTGQGTLEVM